MEEDLKYELYKRGVEEGKKHSSPSPLTIKMLGEQNTKLDVILEKIENVKIFQEKMEKTEERHHKENKEEHAGIIERQDHTNGCVGDLQKKMAYNDGRIKTTLIFLKFIIFPAIAFLVMDYIIKRDDISILQTRMEQIERENK